MGTWISTTSFRHSLVPLKSRREFRVLELLPPSDCKQYSRHSNTPDIIQGELTVHSIDSPPQFTALSYVWGDSSELAEIAVNGKSLAITQTLETALRALRKNSPALHVWVDQICINQLDDNEKDQQIPLMKDIYTRAEETIAWMGEPPSATDIEQAIGYLQRVGHGLKSLGFTHTTKELNSKLFADDEIETLGLVTVDDETRAMKTGLAQMLETEGSWHELGILHALDVFFDMPYFQRGWIKQEVALPTHLIVRCGEYSIDAETLNAGIRFYHIHQHRALRLARQQNLDTVEGVDGSASKILLAHRPGFDAANATMMQRTRYQRDRVGPTTTLAGILRKFKSLPKFTNQKDRIYGFLGLASDIASLNIPITYKDKVSVEEVYTTATKQIIQSGDVDFLFQAYRSENRSNPPSRMNILLFGISNFLSWISNLPFPFLVPNIELWAPTAELPSWVPDFRNMSDQKLIADRTVSAEKAFAAGTSHPHAVSLAIQKSAGPGVLILGGVILDEIGLVGTPWNDMPSDKPAVLNAYEPLRNIQHLNPSHPLWVDEQQRARRMEAFWRVPIADHENVGNALWNSQRATEERSKQGYEELYRVLELSYRIFINNESCTIIDLDEDDKRQLEGLEGDELYLRSGELRGEKLRVGQLGTNYLGALGLFETRRGFLCETGFVGFGPMTMQIGDLICVIFGAEVPVALRPLGNDRYLFIGEVYCDGAMDGEALQWGREERTFYLC